MRAADFCSKRLQVAGSYPYVEAEVVICCPNNFTYPQTPDLKHAYKTFTLSCLLPPVYILKKKSINL